MASYSKSTLERIEFKDPKVGDVPLVVDDWSLAFRLGYKGKMLWHVVKNRNAPRGLYTPYKQKKASGGFRTIHPPSKVMERFLKQIRARLLLPLVAKLGPHVGAYQVGRSPKDAAAYHLRDCAACAPYDAKHTCTENVSEKPTEDYGIVVYRAGQESCPACIAVPKHDCPRHGVKVHFDLSDFFGSTRRSWIRKYFHEVVGYNHYVSTLIAQCLTVDFKDGPEKPHSGVPQGGNASGDICNLVADRILDQPLLAALEETGWRYSRYSDDLYFSHEKNLSSDAVNQLIKQVAGIIKKSGYRMNRKKLQIQRPYRTQKFLGVTINQRLSIPRQEYRRMKAITFNCFTNGFAAEAEKRAAKFKDPKARAEFNEFRMRTWVNGKINYFCQVDRRKGERLKQLYKMAEERWSPNLETMSEAA